MEPLDCIELRSVQLASTRHNQRPTQAPPTKTPSRVAYTPLLLARTQSLHCTYATLRPGTTRRRYADIQSAFRPSHLIYPSQSHNQTSPHDNGPHFRAYTSLARVHSFPPEAHYLLCALPRASLPPRAPRLHLPLTCTPALAPLGQPSALAEPNTRTSPSPRLPRVPPSTAKLVTRTRPGLPFNLRSIAFALPVPVAAACRALHSA